MDVPPGFEMVSSTQGSAVAGQLAGLKGPFPQGCLASKRKESLGSGVVLSTAPYCGLPCGAPWTQDELGWDSVKVRPA